MDTISTEHRTYCLSLKCDTGYKRIRTVKDINGKFFTFIADRNGNRMLHTTDSIFDSRKEAEDYAVNWLTKHISESVTS